MEFSEFKHRYNNAQNRFNHSLQAITVAIEVVAAVKPQRLYSINQTFQTISEYVPLMLNDYEELTAIVDEFCNSQQTWNKFS